MPHYITFDGRRDNSSSSWASLFSRVNRPGYWAASICLVFHYAAEETVRPAPTLSEKMTRALVLAGAYGLSALAAHYASYRDAKKIEHEGAGANRMDTRPDKFNVERRTVLARASHEKEDSSCWGEIAAQAAEQNWDTARSAAVLFCSTVAFSAYDGGAQVAQAIGGLFAPLLIPLIAESTASAIRWGRVKTGRYRLECRTKGEDKRNLCACPLP